MQLTLIDALIPVNIKDVLGDDSYLIDLVGIKGDDAQAYEVGHVVDALILCAFQLQLSCQGLFCLHAMLYGSNVDALFPQSIVHEVIGIFCQLLQRRTQFAKLPQQFLAMWIKFHHLSIT